MLYFYKRQDNDKKYPYVLRSAPPKEGVSAMWSSEGCFIFQPEVVKFMLENLRNDQYQKYSLNLHGWRVLTENDFQVIVNFLETIGIEFTIENDVGRN